MEKNRDHGQQRETAGMIWIDKGKLLVYRDGMLTEENFQSWSMECWWVCALDSKKSDFFPWERRFSISDYDS